MKRESNNELAIAFKQTKSKNKFTELYNRLSGGLRNYIYNITKNVDDTDDIVSIAFTRVYDRIDEFNPEYQITTWIYKIAKNLALGYIKNNTNKLYLSSGFDVVSTPTEVYGFINSSDGMNNYNIPNGEEDDLTEIDNMLQDDYEFILDEINNMSTTYKDIMLYKFVNNMSYDDILDKINKPYSEQYNLINVECSKAVDKGDRTKHKELLQLRYEYKNNYYLDISTLKNRIRFGKKIIVKSYRKKINRNVFYKFIQ